MLAIAGTTSKELARQASYRKAEIQILPFLLPSPRFGEMGWGGGVVTLTHRVTNRLIRSAKNGDAALNELATIVHDGDVDSN